LLVLLPLLVELAFPLLDPVVPLLPEVPLLLVSPLVEPDAEPLLLGLPMLPLLFEPELEPVLLPDCPDVLLPLWSVAEPVVPPVWPLVLEPLCGVVLLEPVCGLVELVLLCDWSLPVVGVLVDEPLVCANRTVTPTISTAIINNNTFFICSPSGSRPVFVVLWPAFRVRHKRRPIFQTEQARR
jgi:hypothetical protein